jgi:hypothetical protein
MMWWCGGCWYERQVLRPIFLINIWRQRITCTMGYDAGDDNAICDMMWCVAMWWCDVVRWCWYERKVSGLIFRINIWLFFHGCFWHCFALMCLWIPCQKRSGIVLSRHVFCAEIVDSMPWKKSPETFLSRHAFCSAIVDFMWCKKSPGTFLFTAFVWNLAKLLSQLLKTTMMNDGWCVMDDGWWILGRFFHGLCFVLRL